MKKILFFIFVLIFLVGIVIPLEAQQQKKKDRWELELSYGQFWVVKHDLPSNLIFEKEKNSDFQLAMRLRIWRGWYVGLTAGIKKEVQNEYFTDEIYTNYWWVESRYGNFLIKNYIERDLTIFRCTPYFGAETKLNLFTVKFSKKIGLTPFAKAGWKKWMGKSDGFKRTIDYIVYDLDKSATTPYMIYNLTAIPLGGGRGHQTQTIWWANPDGSKGSVVYTREMDVFMSKTKTGDIFFYSGGLSFKVGMVVVNGEVVFEKRKDIVYEAGTGEFYGNRKFQHAMWRVGVGYRF